MELKEISVTKTTVEELTASSSPQNWRLAIAFRKYQPGDGFLAWAAAKLLGQHGVMHCDIIMNVPCNETRCGCDRDEKSEGCTSKHPGQRCRPCRYRKLAKLSNDFSYEKRCRVLNASHLGHGHSHVVTVTALESDVMCRLEKDFNYHYFYRIHATQIQANLAEEFLLAQVGAPYNLIGSRCNFNPLLPCFRYYLHCGATWEDVDPEIDPNTGRVIRYSEKITQWEWFCSELATATFCHINLHGFSPETRQVGCAQPCTTSPDDLMHMILQHMKTQHNHIVFSVIPRDDIVRQENKKKA